MMGMGTKKKNHSGMTSFSAIMFRNGSSLFMVIISYVFRFWFLKAAVTDQKEIFLLYHTLHQSLVL